MGLKWSDIDFATGVLTVSRSNYKLTGDSEIRSKSTKTGRSRTLILPPYCLRMLRRYRAEQDGWRLTLGDAWHGDDWIFINSPQNGELFCFGKRKNRTEQPKNGLFMRFSFGADNLCLLLSIVSARFMRRGEGERFAWLSP